MEQQKKQELITLGWLLIIVGIILMIFGFGGEGWVRNQAMNSIFTSYDSYQFWINVNSFRELCQPLSIVLLIGGGILLYSQSLSSPIEEKCQICSKPKGYQQFYHVIKNNKRLFVCEKCADEVIISKAKNKPVSNRYCPTCSQSIPFDSKLCPYCGEKFIELQTNIRMAPFCPQCNIKIDGTPKYCYQCGVKLR